MVHGRHGGGGGGFGGVSGMAHSSRGSSGSFSHSNHGGHHHQHHQHHTPPPFHHHVPPIRTPLIVPVRTPVIVPVGTPGPQVITYAAPASRPSGGERLMSLCCTVLSIIVVLFVIVGTCHAFAITSGCISSFYMWLDVIVVRCPRDSSPFAELLVFLAPFDNSSNTWELGLNYSRLLQGNSLFVKEIQVNVQGFGVTRFCIVRSGVVPLMNIWSLPSHVGDKPWRSSWSSVVQLFIKTGIGLSCKLHSEL